MQSPMGDCVSTGALRSHEGRRDQDTLFTYDVTGPDGYSKHCTPQM